MSLGSELLPWLPISRSHVEPELIVPALVAKYCNYAPLNWRSVIYAREGVDLDRLTLDGWIGAWPPYSRFWSRQSASMCSPPPGFIPTTRRFRY